jgi:hypothetical protein
VKEMVFAYKEQGNERHGTVMASLGMNPGKVTTEYLKSLEREFGCAFESGELLIWVEANEDQAEQIFDTLRRRNSPY